MSEKSPEFVFVRYHTYGVTKDGALLPRPPTAKQLDLSGLIDSFIHVFGEVSGGFETVGTFKVVAENSVELTPRLAPVEGSDPDAEGGLLLGPSVAGLRLPTIVSGGVTDRKYFFLALPYALHPITETKLQKGPPSPIPLVSVLSAGQHFRFFDPNVPAYVKTPTAGSLRVLFIIDPVHAATMLARELEVHCNRVIEFTKPEVHLKGSDGEKKTKERLMKYRLALEMDALRQIDNDLNDKLKDDGKTLTQLLKDMDPTDAQGELGRLIRTRDDFSGGVINLARSDLWNLLEADARETDEHAPVAYSHILNATCQMFERSAECPLFAEFWQQIGVNFPLVDSGLPRKKPVGAIENIAHRFIFSDVLMPQDAWKQPVVLEAARNLFPFIVALSKTIADYSDGNLGDGVQGPDATPQFESFAKGNVNTKAGRVAYRWVYHLRSNMLLQESEIVGIDRVVTWRDKGRTIQINVTELRIDLSTDEFQKFTKKGLILGHIAIAANALGLLYSGLSLRHSIEAKAATDLDILKTGAAALSLIGDDFLIALLARSDTIFNSTTGIKAMKWAGLVGAAVGTIAGLVEAKRTWRDNGEGDVALLQGVGAASGLVVMWGSASALGLLPFAGPPGWLILAGLGVALAAPILAIAFQDKPLEDMFEHSVFGEQANQPNTAPGLAVAGPTFATWAGESVPSIERQLKGFSNAIWVFSCKGLCPTAKDLFGNFPRVELCPQRTLDNSCFEINVSGVWGSAASPVALQGKIRIHYGSDTRIEQLSGTRFGGGPVPSPSGGPVGVIFQSTSGSSGNTNLRRRVDWIIAPADTADRARVQGLALNALTLQIKLIGDSTVSPVLAFPLDEPGKPPKVFSYEVAKTLKQGRTQARLVLETDEIASIKVY